MHLLIPHHKRPLLEISVGVIFLPSRLFPFRLPPRGSGVSAPEIFLKIFDDKSRVWGQFGPENKLIEGQHNEYVICRNVSVLAFHLWPTIFAGAPFRLQNICRNGVPPRSRTTTPLCQQYVRFTSRSSGGQRHRSRRASSRHRHHTRPGPHIRPHTR